MNILEISGLGRYLISAFYERGCLADHSSYDPPVLCSPYPLGLHTPVNPRNAREGLTKDKVGTSMPRWPRWIHLIRGGIK